MFKASLLNSVETVNPIHLRILPMDYLIVSQPKRTKMYTQLKFSLNLSLILFCSISSFAQVSGEWTLRTPFKKSSGIIEMHVSPDQTIHLLDNATYSGVLISEDNGVSYKRGLVSPSKDMHIVNDDILFALRADKLIKTTDRFETSSIILNGTGLEGVFFLNENYGFVSGTNGQIKKTINGGTSWQSLTSGSTRTLKDVFFLDENLGFACGEYGTFLGTTDGGTTWNDIVLPSANLYTRNKIFFISPTQGIVVGVGGEVFYTSDSGSTWTQGTTNTLLQLTDVKIINGNLMAVGYNGIVLKSTDLGQTWTSQILNSFLDNFSITSTASEIYVGSEGGIYKSFDGLNWTFQGGVPWSKLEWASFANDNQGLIAGIEQSGSSYIDVMLRTSDGGSSWINTSISNGGYRGVHMLPNGLALTARYDINQVAISSDFGETWTSMSGPNPSTQYITKAVWLKSEDDFFVGGGNYFASAGLHRYQTGIGWTHDPSVGNVEKILFMDNNFGVLCTIDNEAYKTTDGGDSWEFLDYTSGELNIIDANTFYIGDYVTYDGGLNFVLNTVPMSSYRFFDANTAIGAYTNGFVYKTVDAGVSWQVITTNTLPDANCCRNFHISESNVIAFGSNYNNSDIFTLNIGEILAQTESIEKASEKLVVYPNPASDKLYLKGSYENITEVIIYTVNGLEMGEFNLSEAQEGIDISNLVSGTYFVHMKSNSKIESIHRVIKK